MVHFQFLLTLLLAVPGLSAPDDPAKKAKDLFVVDFTTSNMGGCGYVGETEMDDILGECLKLAQAGLQALDEYASKADAKRLLSAYFTTKKVPLESAELTAIRQSYERVRDWIQQGGPTNDGSQPNKPRLYCYHNWLVKKAWADNVLDKNGNFVRNIKAKLLTIREFYEVDPSTTDIPYWSPQTKTYVFDAIYGSGPLDGFCTQRENQGVTSHRDEAGIITLCPSSFGAVDNNNPVPQIVRMGSKQANPVANDAVKKSKKGAQSVSDLFPTAATLFHELFHLILGNEKTTPEEYQISKLLTRTFAKSVTNPETYTVVSTAYDYTAKSAVDPAGNRVEFSSGYATQG